VIVVRQSKLDRIRKTKREAESFYTKWRVKLESGPETGKAKPKEITWGEFVKNYYEPVAKANLRHYDRSAGYQIKVLSSHRDEAYGIFRDEERPR